MSEIEVNKFDPRIIEKKRRSGHSPICVMIGCRGSGKSILCKDLISKVSLKMLLCMSGTEESSGFYSSCIHELFIYNGFQPSTLVKVMDHQKEIAKKLQDSGQELKKVPDKGIGILMDDLAYDTKMMKEESMKELFFNGRHLCITTFITYQYVMGIPPAFRENIDYVFVSKQNKKDNIDKLYKYFFGMFDKVADFKEVLNSCTDDYGWLVLDNTGTSRNILDQIFWYKADPNVKFKVNESMWPYWDSISKSKKDKQKSESESFTKTKKSSTLVVKKRGFKTE